MKKAVFFFLIVFILCKVASAQDMIYIYRFGKVIFESPLDNIDSLAFSIDKNDSVLVDVEGNMYDVVEIGNQKWMSENLRTTTLNNGTSLPEIKDSLAWQNSNFPAYCLYDNSSLLRSIYGLLYNGYAVNTNKLCPVGWHVPTEADWDSLSTFLIENGYNYDGTTIQNKVAISLADEYYWQTSTYKGTIGDPDYYYLRNSSGFGAVPAGYRNSFNSNYYSRGKYAYYWSSTLFEDKLGYRYLFNTSFSLGKHNIKRNYGFAVRCIKD